MMDFRAVTRYGRPTEYDGPYVFQGVNQLVPLLQSARNFVNLFGLSGFIASHLTCSEGAPRIHREGALELRPRARPLPGGLPSGAAGGRALRPSAIRLKSVASQSFLFVCRRNHIQYPIWRSHKGFAYWLFASFPMLDNVNYQLDQNSIPVVSESELWPRATINYDDAAYPDASSMTHRRYHAMKLVDQVSTEGFMTSGDPLLVVAPGNNRMPIAPPSTCLSYSSIAQ